jgi:phosphoglycerate dehydrogenase-like enzyme
MKIVVTQNVGMTSLQKSELSKLGEVMFYDTVASSQQEYVSRIQWADIIYSEENYMHECIYEMKNSLLTFPFVSFLKPVDISILKSNKLLCAWAKWGNKYAVSERNMVATLQVSRKLKEIMKIENKDIGWNLLSSVSWLRGLSVLILWKWDIGSLT